MQPGGLEEDGADEKIENLKVRESLQQRLVCCKAKSVTLRRVVVDARDRTQRGLNIRFEQKNKKTSTVTIWSFYKRTN